MQGQINEEIIMQFDKLIYEDEDLVEENSMPQSIVINNTSGGTVVIHQTPGMLPSVTTIPPTDGTPEVIPSEPTQPYYDDENEIQPSVDPPVPDVQPLPEVPQYDSQNPQEFPQPYDDEFNPSTDIPNGNGNELPYYDDDTEEYNEEQLPPQEVAQAETPPSDPMAGVPVDPNVQTMTYADLDNIAAENPERTAEIQQQLDNGTFNSTPGPNEPPQYYEDDPQQIDPATGQPMVSTTVAPEVGLQQPTAPPEVDPATGQPYYEDETPIDPATGQPMEPHIDPATGQAVTPQESSTDPATGQPVVPQTDPATGLPVDPASQGGIDPVTGQPVAGQIDPMTGMPMDPMASADPYTSSWSDEKQPEARVGNSSEVTTGRPIPVEDISKITELKKINSQLMRIRGILEKELDKSYNAVEEKLTEAIDYFRTIIANLDSYVNQIDDIITKYKRFIVTVLTQINILKKQEMEDKK